MLAALGMARAGMGRCAMKTFVIVLALLAAGKLGWQEYLFRAGARDALLDAYREHALQACMRDARNLSPAVSPQAWANPQIELVIGKREFSVYPWQVDHANWNARYRNPYLFLTAGLHPGQLFCEYDILNASASVRRL